VYCLNNLSTTEGNLMNKRIILLFLTIVLLTSFTEVLNPSPDSAQLRNVKKWKGEIHYKLDRSEGIYDNRITLLKLKGLNGKTLEKIIIDGTVIFEPSDKSNVYIGQGNVKYEVSIITVSKLGEAAVIHLTDGKGKEKIELIEEINYLKFNYSKGTYSIRITPGISDEEMDAFGVFVESVSELKITRAFINKMEEHNRNVPFPEFLKKMFPDMVKYPDRENIAAEALGMTIPSSGRTLKGSFKDNRGGIFSWKITPIN
jgi:hypothetical protein